MKPKQDLRVDACRTKVRHLGSGPVANADGITKCNLATESSTPSAIRLAELRLAFAGPDPPGRVFLTAKNTPGASRLSGGTISRAPDCFVGRNVQRRTPARATAMVIFGPAVTRGGRGLSLRPPLRVDL